MRKFAVSVVMTLALIITSSFVTVNADGLLNSSEIELVSRATSSSYSDVGFGAKVGIVAVILNRMQAKGFPDSASAVISAEDSGFNCEILAGNIDEKSLRLSRDACLTALSGADPTGGALYFERIPTPSRSDNRPEFEKSLDLSKYSVVIGGVGFY